MNNEAKVFVGISEDDVLEKISGELGGKYEVLDKKVKWAYRFPFKLKREFQYRALPIHETPSQKIRQSLMDRLASEANKPLPPAQDNMDEIKKILEEVVQQTKGKEEQPVRSFLGSPDERILLQAYRTLLDQEVDPVYAKSLLEGIRDSLEPIEWSQKELVLKTLRSKMESDIKVSGSFAKASLQTIALIGSTGVGKTTTLVKIATSLKEGNKQVGMITTDNYRVAAFDQLKEYADYMGCPMIKSKPEELYEPIDIFKYQKGMDHILVDTSGRSPMNSGLIDEIKRYLDVVKPDHVALVLSASQKYSDMIKTIQNYKEVSVDSIIFTKLDETSTYGFLYNTPKCTNLPVSYVTTGQEVPDDIEVADPRQMVQRILKEGSANEPSE